MQPTAMAADENLEQLVIEPLGVVQDLLDLQARFDIEIVADVASLKIEVHDANPALARCLVRLELVCRFEHKSQVSGAPCVRIKRNCDGFGTTRVTCMFCISASTVAREDVDDLPRISVDRDPISIAAAQKRLVVARR